MRSLFAFVLAASTLLVVQQRPPSTFEDPPTLERAIARALEGDSIARLQARYGARLQRNPQDRAALLALATITRLRYDYPTSDSLYRRLFAGARDRYTVYGHLGRAEGLELRSFSRDSRVEYERALSTARALGDRTAIGTSLLQLSFVRGRLEGVAVAEAMLDSAARLIPDTAYELWSSLRNHWAITNALRGRAAEAIKEAQAGIALARRAQSTSTEAVAFRALGQVLQYRGQWDSALVALRTSEQLYQRARNRSALANSLIWHAQVLGSLSRYGEMREVMQRALVEGEATNNPAAVGDAHRAFGVLALMTSDFPAAAAHFKRALAIATESGDSSGIMSTTKYLANVALAANDTATAKRILQQRLEWGRKTQDRGELYEVHRSLAGVALRQGDWTAAGRALDSAGAHMRALPGNSRESWLRHDRARLALGTGELATAERLLKAYIAQDATPQGDLTRFAARIRLAEVYARRAELARAERELQTATDEIDAWRAGLRDAELRTLAFQVVISTDEAASEPAALGASAARVLAALVTGGRIHAAYSLAERWRARELIDQLTRGVALRTGEPQTTRDGSVTSPARNAAGIMAALPDQQIALIQFVASKDAPITVFVVQRSGIAARVLPASDSLAAQVARLSALMESGADASRLSRALGAALLGPVLPLLDQRVRRIVVVPDGPLHHLPFDALRLGDGHYLVERYAVGYAPSASVMATLWSHRPAAQPAAPLRMLALGNPTLPGAAPGTARHAASADFLAAANSAGALTRLEGATREARRVARYAGTADVRVGAQASAAFLKSADLRPYRVLHFATHAIVDEQSLARTALILAPGPGESGFVSAGDLAALRLNADLVVLSACRAARGVLVSGEGVQGLTSPLLQAGARALIATEWRIRDRDAVPFIDAFYDALARGMPVVDALRAAKLDALKHGRSPATWAAFLAIGDPLVTVPLRAPPRSFWSAFRRS